MAQPGTRPAGALRFATFRFSRCSRDNSRLPSNENSCRFASLGHFIGPLLAIGPLISLFLAVALVAFDTISGGWHRHECIAGLGAKHFVPASSSRRRPAFLRFDTAPEPHNLAVRPPSVTPPADGGDAPSVAADH
jgi:hypothetical protein